MNFCCCEGVRPNSQAGRQQHLPAGEELRHVRNFDGVHPPHGAPQALVTGDDPNGGAAENLQLQGGLDCQRHTFTLQSPKAATAARIRPPAGVTDPSSRRSAERSVQPISSLMHTLCLL